MAPAPLSKDMALVDTFLSNLNTTQSFRSQKESITLDGSSLSIAALVVAARSAPKLFLTSNPCVRDRADASRAVMQAKIDGHASVYGVSTGYGGSADTRTSDHEALGLSLLQHLHIGISDTSMPDAWVRAAILVRINSLIRGHSGVRWSTIESLLDLLHHNIIPVVPLRGSISASGDLSPLSYVAGAITGAPSCRVRQEGCIRPAAHALRMSGLTPVRLVDKEHLGILNGTAFSAGLAGLVFNDAVQLALLAQVCTAMCTEALRGTQGSFHPFIHDTARPHPGQVEAAYNLRWLLKGSQIAPAVKHEVTVKLEDDKHSLRQDRYSLRTAPQWLGPATESLLQGVQTVTRELNSTTDNPLVDPKAGDIHHGGNFQALALTIPLASLPLSLYAYGKLLFAQLTELLNPTMNRGLPPNCAGWEPSTDYGGKGIDTASASYTSELAGLANAATGTATAVQSAEMHNQSVNSMALVVGRRAEEAIEVLSMLTATFLYLLAQALDLRALQREFYDTVEETIQATLQAHFAQISSPSLTATLSESYRTAFEAHTTMDSSDQCSQATAALADPLLSVPGLEDTSFSTLKAFRSEVASKTHASLLRLRTLYLTSDVPSTEKYLGKGTARMYAFVRRILKVPMHGRENMERFSDGIGALGSHGDHIAQVYRALRDGQMAAVLADIFDGSGKAVPYLNGDVHPVPNGVAL